MRNGNFDVQFIVDFSQVAKEAFNNEINALTTTLTGTKKTESYAATTQSDERIGIKDAGKFALQIPTGTIGELSYIYTRSSGATSKWDNRQSALVFTPQSGTDLPAENGSLPIQISLAGNKSGSYRLQITADLGLIAVAEAEYYFIIE